MHKQPQKLAILSLLALMSSFVAPVSSNQTAQAAFYSMLAPTNFTPNSYVQPKYDAFDHDYYRPVPDSEAEPDTAPTAVINIFNGREDLQSRTRGTTATRFTFDGGNSTDPETQTSRLEVRWDFENDGKLDSFFSRTKGIQHVYEKAGTYTVKLEVLDTAGNVSATTTKVIVAQNTAPQANLLVKKVDGPEQSYFQFDTSRSWDDQYVANSLVYRFDWNSDGKWDTKYNEKNIWNHRFEEAGDHKVTMEVRDPEGATAQMVQPLTTSTNSAPVANFNISKLSNNQVGGFLFNSERSSDAETPHRYLQYRWDFNNHGPNDIVYDTEWSSSDRFSGNYSVPGSKIIKLEVKDADGAISTTFARIEVPMSPEVLQRSAVGLR